MLVGTKCAVSLPLWVIELGKQTSCLLWLPFQAWKSGCAVVVLPWSHWQVVNGLFPIKDPTNLNLSRSATNRNGQHSCSHYIQQSRIIYSQVNDNGYWPNQKVPAIQSPFMVVDCTYDCSVDWWPGQVTLQEVFVWMHTMTRAAIKPQYQELKIELKIAA